MKELRLPGYLQGVLEAAEIQLNPAVAEAAGPGRGYNDADMLVVGLGARGMEAYGIVEDCPPHVPTCKTGTYVSRQQWGRVGGLTETEERTHLVMWAMLASPLMLGADPRYLPTNTLDLLTNPGLLAVSQDPLGKAAVRTWKGPALGEAGLGEAQAPEVDIWARPLANGDVAVLAMNVGITTARTVRVDLIRDSLGLGARWARDVALEDKCQDTFADRAMCKGWAAASECTKNAPFMLANCAKTCGACSPLVKASASLATADVTDALTGESLGVWCGNWTVRSLQGHGAALGILRFREPPFDARPDQSGRLSDGPPHRALRHVRGATVGLRARDLDDAHLRRAGTRRAEADVPAVPTRLSATECISSSVLVPSLLLGNVALVTLSWLCLIFAARHGWLRLRPRRSSRRRQSTLDVVREEPANVWGASATVHPRPP